MHGTKGGGGSSLETLLSLSSQRGQRAAPPVEYIRMDAKISQRKLSQKVWGQKVRSGGSGGPNPSEAEEKC